MKLFGNLFSSSSRKVPTGSIPLTDPTDVSGTQREVSAYSNEAWLTIYKNLTVISLLFLLLNLAQVGLIFLYNGYVWMVGAPVILLAASALYLWIRASRLNLSFPERKREWLPKVGVLLTVFVNFLAVEFYIWFAAIPAAREKVWTTPVQSYKSLPPPAMSLGQGTFFPDRAVLSNNETQLAELNHLKEFDSAPFSNQRAFWHYGSKKNVAPSGDWNYVTFNGDYTNLNTTNDLFVAYYFYYNSNFGSGKASLGFSAFDRKFIASNESFQLASECAMFQGQLFPAYGTSQISLEQIHIDDKVNAIDLVGDCDRPEYRNYIRYRSSIVLMEGPLVGGECTVDGVRPPANSNDPAPCQGAIDVHFSSMLVTKETSHHGTNWVNILTDEGGIIGGIMFVTWFFSIALM